MTNYPRGSEWRRWDLHVHTPLSILNNQFKRLQDGKPDWDGYIAALEAAPVSVYGITDYFTIDGYKELKKRQAEGRLADKTLLPNIEFRLDQVLSSRHDGRRNIRLNLHVIFSDEVSVEDIEDKFLHNLDFVYEETPTDTTHRLRLKTANLARLGERLIQDHAAFAGTPAVEVGASKAIVSLKAILDELKKDPCFENKYLVVLAADGWDNIPWDGQDHHVRKTLLQASALVFSGNAKTAAWCLGEPPYGEGVEGFCKEFRTLKPCVHGSDAHSEEGIGKPCAKRGDSTHECARDGASCEMTNCWIKADPTFEGLRHLLYEPADRVRLQSGDPTPSKTQYCLTGIGIAETPVNAELHIPAATVPLNTGLVAITGGRGSGKTALVDLLAHCFVDRAATKDRNSFVRRVKDVGAPFETSLTFLGGGTFQKTLLDEHFVEDSNVVYIAQGELEQYIGDESDLNQYVHGLVFNSVGIKNTVAVYDYEALGQEVVDVQTALDAVNGEIDQQEQATAPAVVDALKKAGAQARAEMDDLKKRVAEAEAKLTPEKITAATDRQSVVDGLKASQQKLMTAKAALQAAARFIAGDLDRFAAAIRTANAAIAGLEIGPALSLPEYPDTNKLTGLVQTVDERIRAVLTDIEKQEKDLRVLAAEQKEHATLLGKLREAEAKHLQLRQRWTDLENVKQSLAAKKVSRSQHLRGLLGTVIRQKEQYDAIIHTFSASKDDVLRDLDFKAEILNDSDTLLETAEDLLDNRQAEVAGNERVESVFKTLFEAIDRIAEKGDAALDAIVLEADRLCEDLSGKIKASKVVHRLNLYRMLYRSYLSVEPVVRYKNTALDRLSMGQKATVLMKIYLAEGDCPIIIDSHDDHLDNDSIMEELVGSLRQAKRYRQVILASNNGNVVVNSDADQLIIARREGVNIEYVSGSLENVVIRERALKVLEGGALAFRRRQEKYRLGK